MLTEDGGFALRHAIVAFMMAYDSNLAPIVGQQTTLTSSNAATAGARLDLLEQRAARATAISWPRRASSSAPTPASC